MAYENKAEFKQDASYNDQFDPCRNKKKKKRPQDNLSNKTNLLGKGEEGIIGHEDPSEGNYPDYEYKELLHRVFNALRDDNLEVSGEKHRAVMKPPQFLGEGTKTVCVNFVDLCRTMHRKPEHVMSFLMAETGTRGSLDGGQRLVLKAKIASKDFEETLQTYIDEYVTCNCCKFPDTTITEENRSVFLRCELCGSERSVAPIKTGFL